MAEAETDPGRFACFDSPRIWPYASQDKAACYGWAVQNTGTGPFELAKKAEQQQQSQQAQEATAEQVENFQCVCLEAKEYMVKF